jgi:hypothetical protein
VGRQLAHQQQLLLLTPHTLPDDRVDMVIPAFVALNRGTPVHARSDGIPIHRIAASATVTLLLRLNQLPQLPVLRSRPEFRVGPGGAAT